MDIHTDSYDHRRVATLDDHDDVHREMRAQCPVAHSENYGGFWTLTRHEDVDRATRDTTRFSSLPTVTLPAVGAPKPFIPVECDPPEHQKYRTLLNVVFRPRRIEEFETRIREHAARLMDAFVANGRADLAKDFVFPLTSRVITWFLGIPDEDVARFSEWSLGLVTVGDPEEELRLQTEIRDYYLGLIARRRESPADDLASHLLASTIDGRPVTEDETLDIYLTLTGAGGETTAAAGNNMFRLLDLHRDLRERLLAEPQLIPSAIEEILRYVTPVYGFGRTTTCEVELAGTRIPQGERVWLSWLAANHDESEFPEPGRIIPDRKPNRHLAFGAGVHRCPGAPLARLQLRVMLEEVLSRLPDYRLDDPDAVSIVPGITRVIPSLPVVFNAPPRSNR
ncbi:cytochrome P450 [Streptomyces sp. NPDC047009]|uniref:cytochrome P450 n=1 Tax=Streptomyces sp. NPDC047009 TaxID=3154496 RepID=UPI0033C8E667